FALGREGAGAGCGWLRTTQLPPHPEERPLGRVSKDGQRNMRPILRDGADAPPQDEVCGVRSPSEIQFPLGRTMAQPIRNSGWRPFTSQSKARGTSGTSPGKRLAISGGGVPAVSEARQTTTPPV